jgi:CGNR zinc finger/Putative stress-induced transcription regulator
VTRNSRLTSGSAGHGQSAYAGRVDVQLVLDFLNTVDHEEGVDRLGTEAGWLAWTSEHRLITCDLADARSAREGLRAALGDAHARTGELTVPVQVRLTARTPYLTGQDAVGEVLAAAARIAVRGEWDRFKICSADTCRWAFFDQSRNRSRTWCSMRVCGNREKARAWRERARAT